MPICLLAALSTVPKLTPKPGFVKPRTPGRIKVDHSALSILLSGARPGSLLPGLEVSVIPEEPQLAARPWLSDHFIRLDLPQIEERHLFGKARLGFGPFILELAYFYEVGAVLGSARPGCSEDLIKICFDRWENIGMFLDQPPFHLSLLQKGGDPSYLDLVFEILYSNIPQDRRLEFLSGNADKEQPREEAVASLRMVFMWGIAFGSRFPELTEKLYSEAHSQGSSEDTVVPEIKALGLKKEKRQSVSFAEWQRIILDETRLFVSQHYPELLPKLQLETI